MAQTYQNFELIVVDDGSTDQSAEIIKKYETMYPDKVKAVFKENGGQGSAFNAGFEVVKGDIIAFLDADDYWYSNKLETIKGYHAKYDSVQHNLLINNEYKFTFLEENKLKQKRLTEKYGFLGIIPTSALSFGKNILDKVFPIPENDYKICADNYMRIFSLIYADMISIDEPLGCYRVHGENKWYSNPAVGISFNTITFNKLNEYRRKIGEKSIIKINESETFAQVFIDSIKLVKDKKYIIFGNGELGKAMYTRLVDGGYNIGGFSNSNFHEELEEFYNTKLMSVEHLKKNQHEYDAIIIGSTQLVEIYHFLIEHEFNEERIIVPKF